MVSGDHCHRLPDGPVPEPWVASGGMLSDHTLCPTPSGRKAGGTEYSERVVAVDNGQAAHGAGVRGEARYADDAALARGEVQMRGRCLPALLGVVGIVAMPAVVVAQTHSARTPWGDPDMQGIWTNTTTTPLERPEDLADKAVLTPEEFAARNTQVAEEVSWTTVHATKSAPTTSSGWSGASSIGGRR